MKTIDLKLGNPLYLLDFWKKNKKKIPTETDTRYVLSSILLEYKQRLIKILNKTFDLELDPQNIVIGNGSSQLCNGFLNVLSKKGAQTIFYRHPNLFTFKQIADLNGYSYSDEQNVNVEIIVSPGNPTGEKFKAIKNSDYKLYDYAYNFEQFLQGKKKEKINLDDQFTLTLSKVFGIAGYRIAIGNFPGFATEIQEYIESTTLGVNSSGLDFIFQNENILDKLMNKATNIMDKRWKKILELNDPLLLNDSGGYLWYQRSADIFLKYGIESLKGSLAFSTDDHSRINLMCSKKEFEILLERLKKIISDSL